MSLIWHDAAVSEFVEAAGHYGIIDPDLGEQFIAAVEVAVTRIRATPKLHRKFDGAARKVRIERFPYAVIYWLDQQIIRIVAVMHLHRDPGYWKNRI